MKQFVYLLYVAIFAAIICDLVAQIYELKVVTDAQTDNSKKNKVGKQMRIMHWITGMIVIVFSITLLLVVLKMNTNADKVVFFLIFGAIPITLSVLFGAQASVLGNICKRKQIVSAYISMYGVMLLFIVGSIIKLFTKTNQNVSVVDRGL